MRLNFPTRRGRRGGGKSRLIMALAIAGFALFSYLSNQDYNEVTGERQYVALSPEQEIALGLQALPRMMQQHGGLHPDDQDQQTVDAIGAELVSKSAAKDTGWNFEFHLLRDDQTINAFALPGGQVFITKALFDKLTTPGQLAGVIGHEIGHVVARHGAEHMAKQQLTQGLTMAAVVGSDSHATGQMAAMIGSMVNMKYGRDDELESDRLGVRFMAEAGYDPRSMIRVMEVLAEAAKGPRQPEFFSSHPNPDNRIGRINEAIRLTFPDGVPGGLRA